jgi:2-polyprenyl-3-methyl-5-hydroxy-6-metoxy-1,4-benzoquinol methylase
MNIINCVSCGSTSFKELFRAKQYVISEEMKYTLVRCNKCRLVFLNPQPSEEELKRFYPSEFFCIPEDKVRTTMPSFMMLDKVKETMRFKKKGTLLDIGCGKGGFLQQMQQRGFKVNGLDVSPIACRLASEKVGKENIFEGDLLSANFPQRHYDIITLWHVLEHVNDPVKTLKKIHTLLKNDGLLIICCPNFNSLLRLMFKDKWYPLCTPHHLFHFTFQTLTSVLKLTGYTIKWRKRHFVEPFTNMGSFKESTLRLFGLGRLTTIAPAPHASKDEDLSEKRSLPWRMTRFTFNSICFSASLILSLLGNEEVILIWAVKNTDKKRQ